jgi:glutamyl-tRNA synthetase
MAWLLCRQAGGRLILRMEDLDPQRSRREFSLAAMRDLRWLGLHWDEGVTEAAPSGSGSHAPYNQSARLPCYAAALEALDKAGRVYPCFCTRGELRSLAGAPHIGEEGPPYPGTCRDLDEPARQALFAAGRKAALRLRCPDAPIRFADRFYGEQDPDIASAGGDFVLRRSDLVVAYQLAVVADDGLMEISQVVRGRDILPSTPRQLLLFDLLNLPRPEYAHVPLVRDAQGARLAKRHQSLSLGALREAGVSPEAMIGYLAWKSGLVAEPARLEPTAFVGKTILFPSWWRESDITLDEDPLRALRALSPAG